MISDSGCLNIYYLPYECMVFSDTPELIVQLF